MEKEEKINQNILEILYDKNLFDNITIKELDKKIVGEIEARKLIFLCSCGSLVKNCQTSSFNLLINDEAGSGKDFVTKNTLSLWNEEICIYRSRISPMAFTYWHDQNSEPNWDWNGKILYLEDISEGVLNNEVFKVMCSSGSSATIVVKNQAKDIKINGKPVIITTTATAIPNPELIRRFGIASLTETKKHTEAIIKRHSEYKEIGLTLNENDNLKKALTYLKRVDVKIPFATKICDFFPCDNIITRTLYPRFLDMISASASLYQFQRDKDENDFIIATKQDYEIAKECLKKLTSNKYLIPLTLNQRNIIDIFLSFIKIDNNFNQICSLNKSLTELHSEHFSFMSLPALQTNLGILVRYKMIKTSLGLDKLNRQITLYTLNENYLNSKEINLPDLS